MSLYESEFKGTRQKRHFIRCSTSPVLNHSGNLKDIDPDSLLDDPTAPYKITKIALEELRTQQRDAVSFGRKLGLQRLGTKSYRPLSR